jgi:hypothetical protein
MPFSELIESEASPEISLVYDELRTAIGIPVVNLIWRHLASLPDVLSWAWTTVRPVAGSTILAEGINQLEAIALKNVAHSAALFPAIPDDAMAVVETYNRGNCINLQLLTALRRAVAGEPTGNGGNTTRDFKCKWAEPTLRRSNITVAIICSSDEEKALANGSFRCKAGRMARY